MKISIRYMTTRTRLNGRKAYYWQPSTDLQKAGWPVRRLAENIAGSPADIERAAIEEAEGYNKDLDKWYAGNGDITLVSAKHGSIEALIDLYKKSARFQKLGRKTRQGYEYAFRIINKWCGDTPVSALSRKLIQKYYDTTATKYPSKAAAVVRVLRLLLSFAVKEEMIAANPAEGVEMEDTAEKGLLWSPEAVQYIVDVADEKGYFSIGTAIFLNAWLGQRKGDLIGLPITAYYNGALHDTQNKTGTEVILPIDQVPALKARLEEQIARNKKATVASTVLIAGPNGQPYSEYWFTHLFARIRAAAVDKLREETAGKAVAKGHPLYNLDKLIFKDLRHTAVTRLAEAGSTIPEIASITGHSFRTCEDIVDRYNIRTRKMAEGAFRRRLAAESQTQT